MRFLIRLESNGGTVPNDVLQQQRKLASLIRWGRVGNLRVTGRALEFDLFVDREEDLDTAKRQFSKTAKILTIKRLDVPPTVPDKAQTIRETRNLFNEERYWECHEVLENLWRTLEAEEKLLVQGLILVCAALVHFQKNENQTALSMLKRYQKRLEWKDRLYEGIDLKLVRDAVARLIFEGKKMPFQI